MTRIALAGGHPYEREMVTDWLREVPAVQKVTGVVVREAIRNGRPVVDLLVAIVDEEEGPPLGACRDLVHLRGSRIVAVLRGPSPQLIERCVGDGADALVALASGSRALRHAVECVRDGGAWLDPALSLVVMQRLGWVPVGADELGLTPKEFEVALCFPRGLTRAEIAAELRIGEETVKTHIRSIYTKLDVNDRAAAARLIQTCTNGQIQPVGANGR